MIRFLLPAIFFASPLLADPDRLDLLVYRSKNGLNWETPHALMHSIFDNEQQNDPHSLGHVNIRLFCHRQGKVQDQLAGMTTYDDHEAHRMIMEERIGVGILWHRFTGRMYSHEEIERDLGHYQSSGHLAILHFLISPKACERLQNYLQEYRGRGGDRYYGLANRPRYGEGGGCSAFGVSFLEVAGLDSQEFSQGWLRRVDVGLNLIGGPTTGKKVGALSVFAGLRGRKWESAQGSRAIQFWDPERIFDWIRGAAMGQRGGLVWPMRTISTGRAWEVELDARTARVPEGPIWLQ